MNATGKLRLLKLANFLETADLGNAKFEMRSWTNGLIDEDANPNHKKLGDCGTAACALGWATTIPSFRRAGLTLDKWCFEPTVGDNSPLVSAVNFFDLSFDQAASLFVPSDMKALAGKRGRRIVAKRIRDLVKAT